jgi:archaeal flagellar protein FlaJ
VLGVGGSNPQKRPSASGNDGGKPVPPKEAVGKRKEFDINELSLGTKVLIVTIVISAVIMAMALLSKNFGVIANAIILVTFLVGGPQFLLIYKSFADLKAMEEKFPLFLRDVIEQLRSGMPLHKAIITVGGYDYGKLSPLVKKMSVQLSWGIELDKVLFQFAESIKQRKRLYTNIKIIQESYKSGGDVVATLSTVADNSNLLEDADKERSSLLNQYVVLMYAICFIFVGIVVSVNNLMVPIFKISSGMGMAGGEGLGITNPCASCYGTMCLVCNLYGGTANLLFNIDPQSIGAYYISMFFYMSIMQSLFSGLVAGQIGENSVKAGIKHSMIMVSGTIAIFYLLIYLGILSA